VRKPVTLCLAIKKKKGLNEEKESSIGQASSFTGRNGHPGKKKKEKKEEKGGERQGKDKGPAPRTSIAR